MHVGVAVRLGRRIRATRRVLRRRFDPLRRRGRREARARRCVAPGLRAPRSVEACWQASSHEKWSGPVSRILFSAKERGSFICRPRYRGGRATYPEAFNGNGRFHCSPIWSCSAGGLPCHRHSRAMRCALTAPFHPYPVRGGMFLLHFPSRHRAWTLSSLLPVGVRTFLPFRGDPPAHSERSNTLALRTNFAAQNL